jgi:hypothetical protein
MQGQGQRARRILALQFLSAYIPAVSVIDLNPDEMVSVLDESRMN